MTMQTIDHTTRALSLLISQYKSATNLRAIVSSIAGECDALETVAHDLYDKRALATAGGAQLDCWGEILDVPRAGLDDGDYRARLQMRIAEMYSEGTIEDLIGLYASLMQSGHVILDEYFPASLVLTACDPDPLISIDSIHAVLLAAKCGGVELDAVSSIGPAFAFDGFIDSNITVGGFGDYTDPEVEGGIFSTLI